MSDYTPSRVGQTNGAGDATDLFLKVFPGEVMSAYNDANKIMPLHMVRQIASGKSAQFPASGIATAAYHTPGTQLLGTNAINHAERVISIDAMLTADVFVANIDEAMSHYDVRGEYAKQLGEALAKSADQKLLQVAYLTSRAATPTVTGLPGGVSVTAATSKTDGSVLAGAIFDAVQILDENSVPDNDRFVAVLPAQYYLMVQTDKLLNRDFGGTNGVYADGSVLRVAGVAIVKSNNLPTGVVSAATGENNTYNGTFTNSTCVVWHRSAFGTVKLLDLAVEKDYQISRQGTLMVGKYAMGHGILRPEAAIEIKTA